MRANRCFLLSCTYFASTRASCFDCPLQPSREFERFSHRESGNFDAFRDFEPMSRGKAVISTRPGTWAEGPDFAPSLRLFFWPAVMDETFYDNLGDSLRRLYPAVDFKPTQATRVHAVKASKEIRPGDLLAVPFHCKHESSLPWHFGISTGDDNVIDIGQGRKPEVVEVDLSDFVGPNYYVDVITRRYGDEAQERDLTVKRAKYLVEIWKHRPMYHLALFNCKHFAHLCCSGSYVTQPFQPFLDILEPAPELANGLCGKAQNLLAKFPA
jgi:hypothetical protein